MSDALRPLQNARLRDMWAASKRSLGQHVAGGVVTLGRLCWVLLCFLPPEPSLTTCPVSRPCCGTAGEGRALAEARASNASLTAEIARLRQKVEVQAREISALRGQVRAAEARADEVMMC